MYITKLSFKKQICLATVIGDFLISIAVIFFATYSIRFIRTSIPNQLTDIQTSILNEALNTNYPERSKIVSPLPYKIIPADLKVNAESAILIDTATGSILYEKDADREIPPASMTKLVEMYVVFKAVQNGEVSLDDIVSLPPESWAINMPSDASLMFLASGQIVTLRELLMGLSIASGNDASIAVAKHVSGSMENFVKRMNDEIQKLNLHHTIFVESSGYSEKNITTARDFASFARIYINTFPEALTQFHSQKILRYPLEHNLPDYQKSQGDKQAIIQYNTNKLLGKLPGCDGLKTGFIYESGFNLTLTAERFGTRFLSVTMKGPGIGSVEGNKYRNEDGTTLMEFGFSSFADYHAPKGKDAHSYIIPVPGSKGDFINLVPALDETLTVPFIISDSPGGAASSVQIKVKIPKCIYKTTECGRQYGTITYYIGQTQLRTIPLVADRDLKMGSWPVRIAGKIISTILTMYEHQ